MRNIKKIFGEARVVFQDIPNFDKKVTEITDTNTNSKKKGRERLRDIDKKRQKISDGKKFITEAFKEVKNKDAALNLIAKAFDKTAENANGADHQEFNNDSNGKLTGSEFRRFAKNLSGKISRILDKEEKKDLKEISPEKKQVILDIRGEGKRSKIDVKALINEYKKGKISTKEIKERARTIGEIQRVSRKWKKNGETIGFKKDQQSVIDDVTEIAKKLADPNTNIQDYLNTSEGVTTDFIEWNSVVGGSADFHNYGGSETMSVSEFIRRYTHKIEIGSKLAAAEKKEEKEVKKQDENLSEGKSSLVAILKAANALEDISHSERKELQEFISQANKIQHTNASKPDDFKGDSFEDIAGEIEDYISDELKENISGLSNLVNTSKRARQKALAEALDELDATVGASTSYMATQRERASENKEKKNSPEALLNEQIRKDIKNPENKEKANIMAKERFYQLVEALDPNSLEYQEIIRTKATYLEKMTGIFLVTQTTDKFLKDAEAKRSIFDTNIFSSSEWQKGLGKITEQYNDMNGIEGGIWNLNRGNEKFAREMAVMILAGIATIPIGWIAVAAASGLAKTVAGSINVMVNSGKAVEVAAVTAGTTEGLAIAQRTQNFAARASAAIKNTNTGRKFRYGTGKVDNVKNKYATAKAARDAKTIRAMNNREKVASLTDFSVRTSFHAASFTAADTGLRNLGVAPEGRKDLFEKFEQNILMFAALGVAQKFAQIFRSMPIFKSLAESTGKKNFFFVQGTDMGANFLAFSGLHMFETGDKDIKNILQAGATGAAFGAAFKAGGPGLAKMFPNIARKLGVKTGPNQKLIEKNKTPEMREKNSQLGEKKAAKKLEKLSGETVTAEMSTGLRKAHDIPIKHNEAGNISQATIRAKTKVMKKAGLSKNQRKIALDVKLAGITKPNLTIAKGSKPTGEIKTTPNGKVYEVGKNAEGKREITIEGKRYYEGQVTTYTIAPTATAKNAGKKIEVQITKIDTKNNVIRIQEKNKDGVFNVAEPKGTSTTRAKANERPLVIGVGTKRLEGANPTTKTIPGRKAPEKIIISNKAKKTAEERIIQKELNNASAEIKNSITTARENATAAKKAIKSGGEITLQRGSRNTSRNTAVNKNVRIANDKGTPPIKRTNALNRIREIYQQRADVLETRLALRENIGKLKNGNTIHTKTGNNMKVVTNQGTNFRVEVIKNGEKTKIDIAKKELNTMANEGTIIGISGKGKSIGETSKSKSMSTKPKINSQQNKNQWESISKENAEFRLLKKGDIVIKGTSKNPEHWQVVSKNGEKIIINKVDKNGKVIMKDGKVAHHKTYDSPAFMRADNAITGVIVKNPNKRISVKNEDSVLSPSSRIDLRNQNYQKLINKVESAKLNLQIAEKNHRKIPSETSKNKLETAKAEYQSAVKARDEAAPAQRENKAKELKLLQSNIPSRIHFLKRRAHKKKIAKVKQEVQQLDKGIQTYKANKAEAIAKNSKEAEGGSPSLKQKWQLKYAQANKAGGEHLVRNLKGTPIMKNGKFVFEKKTPRKVKKEVNALTTEMNAIAKKMKAPQKTATEAEIKKSATTDPKGAAILAGIAGLTASGTLASDTAIAASSEENTTTEGETGGKEQIRTISGEQIATLSNGKTYDLSTLKGLEAAQKAYKPGVKEWKNIAIAEAVNGEINQNSKDSEIKAFAREKMAEVFPSDLPPSAYNGMMGRKYLQQKIDNLEAQ